MTTFAIYLTSTDRGPLSQEFPDYAVQLEGLLSSHMPGAEFVVFDVTRGEFPEDPAAFDGVIMTGSAAYVGDGDMWIATLFDHIRQMDTAKTRLFAVCFGHQAVAAALGGSVEKREIVLGAPEMNVLEYRPWMNPAKEDLRLHSGNFEQVVSLPEGMTCIGTHPDCPVAMAEKGGHFLTLQFHPEFSKDYMEAYIEKITPILRPEQIEAGRQSLACGDEGQVMAMWAANFLTA